MSDKKNKITVLSTFAKDLILDEKGNVLHEQEGGPAFYITRVLKNEKMSFALQSAKTINVEIMLTSKGEQGRILKPSIQKKINFSNLSTPYVIISTLLGEFDLQDISAYKGKVFLDIQGYVRDGDNFGKKRRWKPDSEIISTIYCLKGTKEEIKNIPKKFLELQKKRMLIVTDGKNGCKFFLKGARYVIKPKKIIKTATAIGAGDTFFAYFISKLIRTNSAVSSLKYATNKTVHFLDKKIPL